MVLVDRRVGSADLLGPLKDAGLPAELDTLEFADIAFTGKGPKGAPIDIGIELKKIGDLVSSLRSGRLAGHQLPGLRAAYEYSWLLVEGQWRHDEMGKLVTFQGKGRGWKPIPGKMSASELEKQVLTLELCGGLHVRYSPTRRDTIRFLSSLYRWFCDKSMDSHTSHLVVHTAPTLVAISAFRAAVMKFPGIGMRTSLAVEQHFKGSLRRAVCAGAEEWSNITSLTDAGKPRRLGNKDAQKIVSFCEGTLDGQ